jgi:hypothetical protein
MQEAKDVVGQYRRLAVFPLLSMLALMLGFFGGLSRPLRG